LAKPQTARTRNAAKVRFAATSMQHHLRRCGGGAVAALRRLHQFTAAAPASSPAAWRRPFFIPPRPYSTAGERTSPLPCSIRASFAPFFCRGHESEYYCASQHLGNSLPFWNFSLTFELVRRKDSSRTLTESPHFLHQRRASSCLRTWWSSWSRE
jgi:hypothetical protein